MSAQNLLFTIPNEIKKFNIDNLKEFADLINGTIINYLIINNEIPTDANVINNIKILDYYAFVVLAIFRSMIMENEHLKIVNVEQITNSANVHGWLYHLFTKRSSPCIYLYKGNKHLLLSHGGVTMKAINEPELFKTLYEQLSTKDNEIIKYVTDAKSYYDEHNSLQKQQGGYYTHLTNNNNKPISVNQLKMSIEIINDFFKTLITNIYADMKTFNEIPSLNMTFMNMLTTPFDCSKFMIKINKQNLCTNINIGEISPITNGFPNMRDSLNKKERNPLYFTLDSDNVIYQFCGHQPAGYGVSVDCYSSEDNKNKGYCVILDSSNSFLGTTANVPIGQNIYSISYAMINNDGNININTLISASFGDNLKSYSQYHNYTVSKFNNVLDGTSKLFYSDELENQLKSIVIKNQIIDNDMFDNIKKTKDITANNASIFYHGMVKKDDKNYHVLSHVSGFNKNLLVLDEIDFNIFCEKINEDQYNEIQKIRKTPQYNASDEKKKDLMIRLKISELITQKGGSYKNKQNSVYFYKYMKYKEKYLLAKNNKS